MAKAESSTWLPGLEPSQEPCAKDVMLEIHPQITSIEF